MTDHLHDVLERQAAAWQNARGCPPRVPWDPDVAPEIYVGDPDSEEWIGWHPIPKQGGPKLAELAPDLGPFHPSIENYFGTWWFLALEGELDGRVLYLQPNRPGFDPGEYLDQLRDFAAARTGPLRHLPIGFDHRSSLQVVVDNDSGEVFIEDFETGELEKIASSLDDVFQRLRFA